MVPGDIVYVSDVSIERALHSKVQMQYRGTVDNIHVCVDVDIEALYITTPMQLWAYVVKKPKPVQVVKSASQIVKWLEENGYTFVADGCYWRCPNQASFCANMFEYCSKTPSKKHTWLDAWLEDEKL